MAELVFEVVHEEGLGVGVGRAVDVENKDAVVFDEASEVEEIDEDGGGADEDVW